MAARNAVEDGSRRRLVGWRRTLGCLGLLLATGAGARAEDAPTAESLLVQARYHHLSLGQLDVAVERYEALLALPNVDPKVRAAALWGSAECYAALARWPEAERAWKTLEEDERLPEDLRQRAATARAQRTEQTRSAAAKVEQERSGAEELAERERRRRAEADAHVGRGRAAFEQRKFDDALREVTAALHRDPENAEALYLLARIKEEQPDRGELLRSLLRWFQIVRSEAFQRARTRLHELESVGMGALKRGEFAAADEALRQAVYLIDQGEFRAELEPQRANLVFWMQQVATQAASRGLAFAPEPTAPPEVPSSVGMKARFYALLADTFAGRDESQEPIRFYEFAPESARDDQPRRSLGPNSFASPAIAVEQTTSDLTRARWAERYARTHLATDWPAPTQRLTAPASRRPGPTPPPRILERLDDVLFVQHTEAVQREIATMRDAFATRPPSVQVDVALYGAGAGGTVRLATLLGVPAPPVREAGLDAVVSGRLIEECRKELVGIEGLTPLGIAQLRLVGDVALRLEVTERTDAHPLHQALKPPVLSLPDLASARYGLLLDLYAEDLPRWKQGVRTAAISLLARVKLPLPSVVVRRTDTEWARLPKFAEAVATSDRRVPHAGTLVLQGLPNPFVDSAGLYPDLVILVGVRPAGSEGRPAPTPDIPPAASTGPRVDMEQHGLGPLGVEVLDDVIMDGWPEDKSAAAPLAEALLRDARDAFLAAWMAGRAQVLAADGTHRVTVREGLASARGSPEEQVRLGEAAASLRANETTLYDVDVWAVEVAAAAAETWTTRAGVTPLPGGASWLVPATLAHDLDEEYARWGASLGSYGLRVHQVARATQQVALRRLAIHGITRQLRVARSAEGEHQRFVSVPGTAEEGLVVSVRPGVEEASGRLVTLRARAVALKAIEAVPLEGAVAPGLAVDVPRWHALQDRSTGTLLADGDAMLVRLSLPEAPDRVLLVRVVTRRLQ